MYCNSANCTTTTTAVLQKKWPRFRFRHQWRYK